MTTHYRTCPLCEATCGLEILTEGDQVVRIRGDRDDVFSKGFLCPKGPALKQLHHDPDRLRQPMVRTGSPDDPNGWTAVSWDEAFAEIQRRLDPVLATHGRESLGAYVGNPNAHSMANTFYLRPLLKGLGTRNLFSASTVDQMPKHVSSGLMFGGPLLMPVPDIDRSDLLVILGADPYESNGSLATAPDWPGRLDALKERGGRLVVIDPRRSRTAKEASQHLFINPGTDAHLLMAIIHVIGRDALVDTARLTDLLNGVDQVLEAATAFSPERVAPITGIDAPTIEALATEIAAAPSASVYGRIGVHTGPFGTLTAWAVDAIAALTGNLDEPGGHMFPFAAHHRTDNEEPGGRGFAIGRWASRVRELPEALGELPVAALAEEILTEGDGAIRALFTVAGNPARSTPDSAGLEKALASLDLMVCVDPYLNETTRFAHVILPPPTPLERSHYDLSFYNLSVRNIANYSPQMFEPDGPSEAAILARLALLVTGSGADADPAIVDDMVLNTMVEAEVGRPTSPVFGRDPAELLDAITGDCPTDRILDFMVRTGPYGEGFGADPTGLSLARLIAEPHGIDLGPLEPRLPNNLRTPDARVELAPQAVLTDIHRLREQLDTTGAPTSADDTNAFSLIGRRQLRSNNSWMHNLDILVKGKPRCTLLMHPDDAQRVGLADGDQAAVSGVAGELVAAVELSDDMMLGVVSLPHGWGHDAAGARMEVAAAHAGVNSNILTDAAPVDPLSGNAQLNAIPVTVAARS